MSISAAHAIARHHLGRTASTSTPVNKSPSSLSRLNDCWNPKPFSIIRLSFKRNIFPSLSCFVVSRVDLSNFHSATAVAVLFASAWIVLFFFHSKVFRNETERRKNKTATSSPLFWRCKAHTSRLQHVLSARACKHAHEASRKVYAAFDEATNWRSCRKGRLGC